MMIKNVFRLFLIGLCFYAADVIAQPAGLDAIVAVVNDKAITNRQLQHELSFMTQQMQASHQPMPPHAVLQKKVLDHMVDTELQFQVAKKLGMDADKAMVDKAIAQVAEQNGLSAEQMKAEIVKEKINLDDYQKKIKEQLILSQVEQREVGPRVSVTDQEVADFINLHRKELMHPEAANPNTGYHLDAIIIPLHENPSAADLAHAKEVAAKVIAQLHAGADPQKIATSSLGTQENLQQNDLGWRRLAELPDLYISTVHNLGSGDVSGPIRAPNGFHILKVLGIQGQAPAQKQHAMVETHVRHILIKTTPLQTDSQVKVLLNRLRANIVGGGSFEQSARISSQDPISAIKGGDLEWMSPGMLDPEFEKVMDQTKPGQVSQPFKTKFGWHILQVLERRPIKDSKLALQQRAKEAIFQRKFAEEVQNWVKHLRNSQYVKVFIN